MNNRLALFGYILVRFLFRSRRVGIHYRIINAVNICVETEAGGIANIPEAVGADKATPFGVVVPGLQVVIPGFRVVVIAAVTQGVELCNLVLLLGIVPRYGFDRVAPFVIGICRYRRRP